MRKRVHARVRARAPARARTNAHERKSAHVRRVSPILKLPNCAFLRNNRDKYCSSCVMAFLLSVLSMLRDSLSWLKSSPARVRL